MKDSTQYLAAVSAARLAVLHTAKLTGSADLFSVASLFAALKAEGELLNRGVR